VIVGIIRRKPVLTHASIIFGGMLASVNLANSVKTSKPTKRKHRERDITHGEHGTKTTMCKQELSNT